MIRDLSNKPDGATHYNPSARTVFWYQKTRMGFDQFKGGRWTKSHDKKSVIDGLVAIPSVDWNGEGLPPVGASIEWCGSRGGYWVRAKVVAATTEQIVVQHAADQQYKPGSFDTWSTDGATNFRPVRTAEQIAAEDEREKAAILMYAELESFLTLAQCQVAVKAGYRKHAAIAL